MKQQLIQQQKQTTKQKIEKKTQQLAENLYTFKYVEKKFTQTSMKLVNELIDLHRISKPNYSFENLIQEKQLMDYSDLLEKYIPYNVSPMVSKLYHEGKLDNADLMVLANTDKEFKQPEQQRKIVEGIINHEIKSRELIRASKNEIREMIGEDVDEFTEENQIMLKCFYQIEQTIQYFDKYKREVRRMLKDKKNEKKLIDSFYHLRNKLKLGLKLDI